jgi:hypothetical protein
LLTKLPCDKTFTQDPFHKWDLNKENFWSLDLSSATDRFPVELQKRLLARIYDITLAQSWQFILSQRDFSTPEGGSVRYSTGQPMGTYSSWSVFTLTHHLVVYYCAHLNGLNNFNQYMILGDDIVIKNDAVAKTYIDVIGRLGVELSLQKTHVSSDTYEFAKRWIQFKANREITGLPLGGILRNFNNPNIVFTVLYDYFKVKKNFNPSSHSLVSLVNSLYFKIFLIKNKKKFFILNKKMLNQLRNLSLMLDVVFDYYNYDAIRKLFAYNITNPEYMIPDERVALLELKRILSKGLVSKILEMNRKIIMSPQILFDKFNVEDRNSLTNSPIFLAIFNTMSRMKNIEFNDINDLHNISKKICDINIDSIFNKDRNKIQSLIEIGKILKDGFRLENRTTEVYYGSATLTDSYTLEGIGKIVQNNINTSELEQVADGKYDKDRAWFGSSNYISMWENFKM